MYSYLLNLLDPLLLVFRWFFVSFSKPQKSWKLRDFGGVVLAQLTWRVGVPIFAQWSCAENVRKRGARKISNSCVGKVFRLRTFYGEWGIYPSGDISQHGMNKFAQHWPAMRGHIFNYVPVWGWSQNSGMTIAFTWSTRVLWAKPPMLSPGPWDLLDHAKFQHSCFWRFWKIVFRLINLFYPLWFLPAGECFEIFGENAPWWTCVCSQKSTQPEIHPAMGESMGPTGRETVRDHKGITTLAPWFFIHQPPHLHLISVGFQMKSPSPGFCFQLPPSRAHLKIGLHAA